MKLTCIQVNNIYEMLKLLIEQNVSVPMKTGFKLLYDLQQLNPLYTYVQQKYNEIIDSMDSEEDRNKAIEEAIEKIKDEEVPMEYEPLMFNPVEFDGYRFTIEQTKIMIPLLKVGQNEQI